MTSDSHSAESAVIGMAVVGFNGEELGTVHEVHPHYILVRKQGHHEELDVPVHAILGVSDGKLHVHVNRQSSTPVDDSETVHNLKGDE